MKHPPAEDSVLQLSGDIDGLPADLSENFDRYLNETLRADQATRPGRRRDTTSPASPEG